MDQNTELKPVLNCLNLSIRKAERMLTQLYDKEMRASGLRVMQFNILRAIRMVGKVNNKQLQDILSADQTTLSRNIKVLIEKNLISVETGSDRRERLLELTNQGNLAMERAEKGWVKARNLVEERLGSNKVDQIINTCVEIEEI